MENLDFLYLLARFINNIHEYKNSEFGTQGEQYTTQKEWLLSIINASTSDPVKAYSEIREKIKTLQKSNAKVSIESNFISLLEKMISTVPMLADRIKGEVESPEYYRNIIKSLVRPGFSTTRIYTAPPSNTEFLERYDVQRSCGRILPITIYTLTDRPESLYFTIPAGI